MKCEKTPQWVRLELEGEIDLAWREDNADEIRLLLDTCPPVLIIDVEKVTFMDSTGLSVIALCYQKCHSQAGTVYLTNPQPMVIKAVETVGLSRFLEVVDTSESAQLMDEHIARLSDEKAQSLSSLP